MTDPSAGRSFADEQLSPCSECGYDLRGASSPVCSECGAIRQRAVLFFDLEEFDVVCRILLEAGIAFRPSDEKKIPLDPYSSFGSGPDNRPKVWLAWTDQCAAEAAVEEAGHYLSSPIVEVELPYCPCCGFELDLNPDDTGVVCAVCHTRCTWFSGD